MYNEKGILWKSILEIQGIPLIVIPYRYGVLTIQLNGMKPKLTITQQLIRPLRGLNRVKYTLSQLV